MLTFRFFGADGAMTVPEKLTTGMLGRQVKLEFSSEWDDLTKTAVFAAGDVSIAVHGVGEIVTIPAEVLLVPMQRLYIGIYGELSDGTLIIPTIYARGPRIERGADPYGAVAGNPPMPKWKELEEQVEALEKNVTAMEEQVAALEQGGSGNSGSASGGLSQTAVNLLVTILHDCVTYNGQTYNIDALEALLKQPAMPSEGVQQIGSVLRIVSGVTVTQDGSKLIIT